MATMTEITTDKRVDDLRLETHRGFDQLGERIKQVDRRVDDLRAEMHHGFDRVEADVRELRSEMKGGFDSLHKTMVAFFATTLGSIVATIVAGIVLFFLTHS
jgi:hypothetical protein